MKSTEKTNRSIESTISPLSPGSQGSRIDDRSFGKDKVESKLLKPAFNMHTSKREEYVTICANHKEIDEEVETKKVSIEKLLSKTISD